MLGLEFLPALELTCKPLNKTSKGNFGVLCHSPIAHVYCRTCVITRVAILVFDLKTLVKNCDGIMTRSFPRLVFDLGAHDCQVGYTDKAIVM